MFVPAGHRRPTCSSRGTKPTSRRQSASFCPSTSLGEPLQRVPVRDTTASTGRSTFSWNYGADRGPPPQSHRAQGVECLGCARGPSYHGPHKRNDPSCILQGCTSTDPAEVRVYLKQKTFEKAVAEALQKQPDQQDREPPPQPAAQSGSTEALWKRCLRGSSSHCKHVATATNCILFGKQGLGPAQVKALLWQHEAQLASDEARGQQPGDTPTSSSAVQGGSSSSSSSSKTAVPPPKKAKKPLPDKPG